MTDSPMASEAQPSLERGADGVGGGVRLVVVGRGRVSILTISDT